MTNQSNSMEVSTFGSGEICTSKRETTWGCSHSGDARIWNPENSAYYSYNENESIDITNGKEGSYKLTVRHHFSEKELYYDMDHSIRSTLTLSIDGDRKEEFQTKWNKNTDTHLESGEINPSYVGDYQVHVSCDDLCICHFVKQNLKL